MEVKQGNQEEIEKIEEIETPDITGMSIKEAKKVLKESELTLKIESEEIEEKEENIIIKEQTPKAGIVINKGSIIYITY